MNKDLTATAHRGRSVTGGLALALLAGTGALHADDTEVFFGQVDLTADNRPNVLFVLDTSGSMLEKNAEGVTRMTRLQDAMYRILDSSKQVNIGLMRFNGALGGGSVVEPVTFIDKEICAGDYCAEEDTRSQVVGQEADASENLTTGMVDLTSDVLSLGSDNEVPSFPQAVGLSFAGLDIPQGSRIVSATIEFNAQRADDNTANLEITAEPVDDATPYEADIHDISARPAGTSVAWAPGPWEMNGFYETPDISSAIQAVTDRAGWCAQNALNVVGRGSGSRSAKSTGSDPDNAPTLKVRYDATEIPPGEGCHRKTVSGTVSASTDDTSQVINNKNQNGQVFNNLPRLRVPRYYANSYEMISGLRFRGLGLPPGAVIEDARLYLQGRASSGATTVSARISALAADDAKAFPTSRFSISNLPRTGAVDWNFPAIVADEEYASPNLAPVLQALVDRGGWTSTSAVSLFLTAIGGSGYKEFRTRDGDGYPTLSVSYRTQIGSAPRKARDLLKLAVSNLEPQGGTPIAGALYEATQYLRGQPVDYGKSRGYDGPAWYFTKEGPNGTTGHLASRDLPRQSGWKEYYFDRRSRKHRVSHPDSWTQGALSAECRDLDPNSAECKNESIGGKPVYTSPIIESCQTNHVVLLSDGEPTGNAATTRIQNLIGESCDDVGDFDRQCGSDLARWMKNTDFNSRADGIQGITTYTIGFDLENNVQASSYLRGISDQSAGGGGHYSAKDTEGLVRTFEDIISSVTDVDTAFVSPGATVNQFNRLTHRNDIYFSLFKPTDRVRWPGNLKRYRITDDSGAVVIQDVNGDPAIDEAAGFFATDSHSFWSDAADGIDVSRGGFAGELALVNGATPRQVYTYTGPLPAPRNVDLTDPVHKLHEDNPAVEAAMLAIPEEVKDREAYRRNLLAWGRGVDVDDRDGDGSVEDIRLEIGDPMHSQPVILNYGSTPADNETTVFVSTNQGFLHALDPEVNGGPDAQATDIDAREIFSWIPQELLGNLGKYQENRIDREHHYGLDGSMSIWIDDKDGDLTVDPSEKAFLFVGMRRGGNSYYALDVSDRDSPTLAWVITGGPGGTAGFEQLGQTWARPVPARVQKDGEQLDVLVFTGGYSTNQDPGAYVNGAPPPRTSDDIGAGVFMVDIATGELVWSALNAGVTGAAGKVSNFPGMDYSMPGSAEVLDVNVDGLVDQIYASDTGGQVWRFDIEPYHRSDTFVRGGIFAKLGSETDPTRQRRFYYEPDASLIERDGQRFVSISIGSGWRAHPLNETISDRFYVLRSPHLYERPDGYGKYDKDTDTWSPITDLDLVDAASNELEADVNGHGWYKTLDAIGEKVLASSLTVNNKVAFTSYKPSQGVTLCSAAVGSGAVYVLDIVSGKAVNDLDGDGDVDENDDSSQLKHPGVPPGIVAIFTENDQTALVGGEQVDIGFGLLTQRTYWTDLSGSPDATDLEDLLVSEEDLE